VVVSVGTVGSLGGPAGRVFFAVKFDPRREVGQGSAFKVDNQHDCFGNAFYGATVREWPKEPV